VLEADSMSTQGVPRLARKAAYSLHEPSQEIWRRRSCGYVRFSFGGRTRLNLIICTTPGPNEIMLNDVSAIAPLLGPGGWGKGMRT